MKKNKDIDWQDAPDIKKKLSLIVKQIEFHHVDIKRIICFRSFYSKAYARARIWSLPRVWQLALNIQAHYVIEVLSEKFDKLSDDDKTRVLIHELMHIPKNFSGSLVPHRGRYHRIDHRTVEQLFRKLSNGS